MELLAGTIFLQKAQIKVVSDEQLVSIKNVEKYLKNATFTVMPSHFYTFLNINGKKIMCEIIHLFDK